MKTISAILIALLLLGTLPAAQASGSVKGSAKSTAAHRSAAQAARTLTSEEQAIHVLNRLAFGPRPGDLERIRSVGVWNYINQQLTPSSIADPLEGVRFGPIEASRKRPLELLADYQQFQADQRNHKMNFADNVVRGRRPQSQTMAFYQNLGREYQTAKLQRAIYSPRQLQEVMTEFWYQHFNVCINKDIDRAWVGPYEDQAIRPYALGRFRDLVGATCHHPAMLFYLDNWENTAPKSAGAKGNQKGLNENYARELMELHTLGVDGGYTQHDVIELARILTGLGFQMRPDIQPNPQIAAVGNYGASFDASRHDFGDKVLLGRHFAGAGEAEVEEALDLLCRQPATARHISFKIAQYFIADNPPKPLVEKMASRFIASDGNIRDVMIEMIRSPEFWSASNCQNKYKSPFRYAVSAIRASGVQLRSYDPIIDFLNQEGQPLYAYLTPDGYKNTKDAWLNSDALLKRINFAISLAGGTLPNNSYAPPEYRQLGATVSGSKFAPLTVSTIMTQPDELRSALLLGSPDFMYY
ncbi:MAG TPA: DUF1800 domain-containing protein [Planktothrix sp.]|jgi:uncharacterized protein (DUF1800 family)